MNNPRRNQTQPPMTPQSAALAALYHSLRTELNDRKRHEHSVANLDAAMSLVHQSGVPATRIAQIVGTTRTAVTKRIAAAQNHTQATGSATPVLDARALASMTAPVARLVIATSTHALAWHLKVHVPRGVCTAIWLQQPDCDNDSGGANDSDSEGDPLFVSGSPAPDAPLRAVTEHIAGSMGLTIPAFCASDSVISMTQAGGGEHIETPSFTECPIINPSGTVWFTESDVYGRALHLWVQRHGAPMVARAYLDPDAALRDGFTVHGPENVCVALQWESHTALVSAPRPASRDLRVSPTIDATLAVAQVYPSPVRDVPVNRVWRALDLAGASHPMPSSFDVSPGSDQAFTAILSNSQ